MKRHLLVIQVLLATVFVGCVKSYDDSIVGELLCEKECSSAGFLVNSHNNEFVNDDIVSNLQGCGNNAYYCLTGPIVFSLPREQPSALPLEWEIGNDRFLLEATDLTGEKCAIAQHDGSGYRLSVRQSFPHASELCPQELIFVLNKTMGVVRLTIMPASQDSSGTCVTTRPEMYSGCSRRNFLWNGAMP